MKIKQGSKVKVEYEGKLDNGQVFDTNKGKEPLSFEVGAKKVIPGFEKQIIGMKKDETKTIKIKPEDAYGLVNEKLIVAIPRQALANRGVEPKPGMRVKMEPKDPKYPPRIAAIKEVTEDKVMLDCNHPLAGKTLTFQVKIIDVE
jgi:FKBP-type peptidyl-prolyl cis-trans isomerase 2